MCSWSYMQWQVWIIFLCISLRSSQKVVGYSYSIHAAIVLMAYLARLAIIITFSNHIWVRLLIETFLYRQPEESFALPTGRTFAG